MVVVDPHPLFYSAHLLVELPRPLGEMPSPDWLRELLRLSAPAPLKSSDELRGAIRDLLRHGGYKPTGRGKPASEYLLKAAETGLSSINFAVDVCNAVSLHSGLPISVVDLDLTQAPLKVGIAPPGAKYVFNASGQEIDLSGLLSLMDAHGPCANAVKDSQRTKTHASSRRTLSVIWGAKAFSSQVEEAARWYKELTERGGAKGSLV